MDKWIDAKTFKSIGRGILAINKKKGMTSAGVVECVKERIIKDVGFRETGYPLKVGHGGTLDSTATGVLVIGLCWGCKLLSKLLCGQKAYRVTGMLGIATDTYNDIGKVTYTSNSDFVTEEKLKHALSQFRGPIMQKPPVYSALKRGGRRLSDIARSGEDVTVSPRLVHCHYLECTSFSPPYFKLTVTCGGGFYVRSLVHDIGLAVGTYAHITDLKRIKQHPFTLDDCLEIEELTLKNIENSIYLLQRKYNKEFKNMYEYKKK